MSDCWEIKAVSKDQCSWNLAAPCAQNWDAVLVLSVFCLATHSLIKSARIFCKTDIFFQNCVIANLCAALPLIITTAGTSWQGETSVSSPLSPRSGEGRGAGSQAHADDPGDAAAGGGGAVGAASPGGVLRWGGGHRDSHCLHPGWGGFRVHCLCSGSCAACGGANCGRIGAGALESNAQRRWFPDLPKPQVWGVFCPNQKRASWWIFSWFVKWSNWLGCISNLDVLCAKPSQTCFFLENAFKEKVFFPFLEDLSLDSCKFAQILSVQNCGIPW